MSGMFNNGYIKYRKKVDEYLQNPDPKKLEKLFEDIKAASFMGELEESDADYLISELPIQTDNDLDDLDDEDENLWGISFSELKPGYDPRNIKKDEFDDFEEEEEEDTTSQSGFLGLY